MDDPDLNLLQTAIQQHWPHQPSGKAAQYVGKISECQRIGVRISGRVQGNHGIYRVSIRVNDGGIDSACSCYIGKGGYCHHCAALAATFFNNPSSFPAVEQKQRKDVHTLLDLSGYLAHTTLESLLQQLKEKGITQTAFAQAIGSSPQHVGAVKKSELSNRIHNELGAIKLACLWVLDHLDELMPKKE